MQVFQFLPLILHLLLDSAIFLKTYQETSFNWILL